MRTLGPWLLLLVGLAGAAPAAAPEVTLVVTPVCEDGANEPSVLAFALSLPAAGRPVFQLPDEVMGTRGASGLISDATARDDGGPISLTRRVRDGVLELRPARATRGTLTFEYRARSISAAGTGAVEGLRHDATGIGGHGRHFIVLPESQRRYRMRISWGAATCPAGTRGEGASTFGGSAPSEIVGELSALREAVYYWGLPQTTTADDGALHLRTAWFGATAIDVPAAGAWAAKVFAAERAFFGDDDPGPYSIFVRLLQSHEDRANGIGQETSYLSWIGPKTTFARRLKVNIAHEMLHRWLGLRLRLRGAEGTAYWFSEGFTVHYASVIAFRAGQFSVDEFLETINDIATRHFANKRAGATNARIARDFVRDVDVSIVPYTRGALYAAELDTALRRASGGKRTLDDLLRALYVRARGSGALPGDAVRRLVRAELGPSGVARYDAVILGGRDPDPPADAYGPCFTRKPRAPKGFTWERVPGVPDTQCHVW